MITIRHYYCKGPILGVGIDQVYIDIGLIDKNVQQVFINFSILQKNRAKVGINWGNALPASIQ